MIMEKGSMVEYSQCLNCNYQFLTKNDYYCRKCGNTNPQYSEGKENDEELINLIKQINENINACVNELSSKIDKIEKKLGIPSI